jgi:NitT/TauT family transport system ATP-binding protein
MSTASSIQRTALTAGNVISIDSAQPLLRLDGIRKSFRSDDNPSALAIANIDLSVNEGEFVSIVGPSGCGKSTLLQIAAGLIAPTRGTVLLDGCVIHGPPYGLIYLFQQYTRSLFPWRTAIDNVAFATEGRSDISRKDRREHSKRYLDMVGLSDFSKHYPAQLSGGMQQRVVIARALAAQPKMLLLDEPFSSVDALTRMELHSLILQLWDKYRFTIVLVTHDVDEAVFLADRVVMLSQRPTAVLRDIPVSLPRPRDAINTRERPEFLELRHLILSHLLGRT